MPRINFDLAALVMRYVGMLTADTRTWGLVSQETAIVLRDYPLGLFSVLSISLVLDCEFLPVMLRLSKAFTKAIQECKTPMALVNRVVKSGCSRESVRKFLVMLQKYAGDGILFISLYRMNLVGENMLKVLVLVGKCKYLKDLDLDRTRLTCSGVKVLVRVFVSLKKLELLTLNKNRIKGPGLFDLANAFAGCPCIKKVELECNPLFWDTGLIDSMWYLRKLDLAKTRFTDEYMEVLLAQQRNAKENSRVLLEELRLDENGLTELGGGYAADLMMLGELDCLCINENKLGNGGAVHIAEALKTSKIRSLLMSKNEIGRDGALALASGLKANASVVHVTLQGNKLSEEGIAALQTVCGDHKTVRLYV